MKPFNLILCTLFVLLVSGCKTTQEIQKAFEAKDIRNQLSDPYETQELTKRIDNNATYLLQLFLNQSKRKHYNNYVQGQMDSFAEALGDSVYKAGLNDMLVSGFTGMNPNSSLSGASTSLGLSIISGYLDDRPVERTGGIIYVESKDAENKPFSITSASKKLMSKLGYSIECIVHCDKKYSAVVYKLTNLKNTKFPLLFMNITEGKLDSLTKPEKIRYKYMEKIYDYSYGESSVIFYKPLLVTQDEALKLNSLPEYKLNLFQTEFGRDLYRKLTAQYPLLYLMNYDENTQFMSFQGNVYEITDRSNYMKIRPLLITEKANAVTTQ